MFTFNPTPSSNNAENIKDSKSDTTDTNFSGHREHSNVSDAKDYTGRTGNAPNKKENPSDKVVKDIDDMEDLLARKREFSRRDETSDVQKSNEAGFITKTDGENRPRMDEGSDAVQKPESHEVKRHRKPNQWQFGTESVYEGEIS